MPRHRDAWPPGSSLLNSVAFRAEVAYHPQSPRLPSFEGIPGSVANMSSSVAYLRRMASRRGGLDTCFPRLQPVLLAESGKCEQVQV